MADSVDEFLTENSAPSPTSPTHAEAPSYGTDPQALPLGLTFSFPVEQTALDEGYLLTWTKGFSAKNTIGKDIVKLLQDAFDRKHLHVRCVALVNDVSCLSPTLDPFRGYLAKPIGWRRFPVTALTVPDL